MLKASKEITPDLLITDIVNDNYRTAEVFRKYNIDFCPGGKMSLNTACRLKGLHEPDILEELGQLAYAYQNVEQWSVEFIIDYLINVHHNYFKKNIPVLHDYINSFMLSPNKKAPEIQELPAIATQLCDKLTDLVNYERDSLFPYTRRIIYAYNNNEVYGKLFIKTLRKLSAEDLAKYHTRINVFTIQIEGFTNNFSLPENVCATHKIMLQKFHEFIDYIKQHFSLEKKILIPAILQMEKSLLEKVS